MRNSGVAPLNPAIFEKDYNGKAIVKMLNKINENFYPMPLKLVSSTKGRHHLEPLKTGFLNKSSFEKVYDRLGKFLHADNPWGKDKGVANLAKDIPSIVERITTLLNLHGATIRTPEVKEIWIIEVNFSVHGARIAVGKATGDFTITNN